MERICPGHAGKETLTWRDCGLVGGKGLGVRQGDGRNDLSRCLLKRGTQLVGPESALLGSGGLWDKQRGIFPGQHVSPLNTVLRQGDTDLCSYMNSVTPQPPRSRMQAGRWLQSPTARL